MVKIVVNAHLYEEASLLTAVYLLYIVNYLKVMQERPTLKKRIILTRGYIQSMVAYLRKRFKKHVYFYHRYRKKL